ncbi:MAG: hypothetical protein LBJ09_00075, partial [Clostridiales bacterium]|nr:hypothetical protein [Clostridiales bacterium]
MSGLGTSITSFSLNESIETAEKILYGSMSNFPSSSFEYVCGPKKRDSKHGGIDLRFFYRPGMEIEFNLLPLGCEDFVRRCLGLRKIFYQEKDYVFNLHLHASPSVDTLNDNDFSSFTLFSVPNSEIICGCVGITIFAKQSEEMVFFLRDWLGIDPESGNFLPDKGNGDDFHTLINGGLPGYFGAEGLGAFVVKVYEIYKFLREREGNPVRFDNKSTLNFRRSRVLENIKEDIDLYKKGNALHVLKAGSVRDRGLMVPNFANRVLTQLEALRIYPDADQFYEFLKKFGYEGDKFEIGDVPEYLKSVSLDCNSLFRDSSQSSEPLFDLAPKFRLNVEPDSMVSIDFSIFTGKPNETQVRSLAQLREKRRVPVFGKKRVKPSEQCRGADICWFDLKGMEEIVFGVPESFDQASKPLEALRRTSTPPTLPVQPQPVALLKPSSGPSAESPPPVVNPGELVTIETLSTEPSAAVQPSLETSAPPTRAAAPPPKPPTASPAKLAAASPPPDRVKVRLGIFESQD